jgi:hypothetical protein
MSQHHTTSRRAQLAGQRVIGQKRGFTAVELVVSLSAGLIIAASAFSLARNATTFFKSETSIGSAQFSALLGLNRLQAELKRAGFKSTPNIMADPQRCGGTGSFGNGMLETAGVQIVEDGSAVTNAGDHLLTGTNLLTPDAIIIGGMFFGTEHYAVQSIVASGGGYDIRLQTSLNDGAHARTVRNAATTASAYAPIFSAGRYLRLVDLEGREAWGVITGFDTTGTYPTVSLAAVPALPLRETEEVCGCSGSCVGALINPVVRMRYDLRSIDPVKYPQYDGLYDKSTHGLAAYHKGTIEPQRTELVRVELDAANAEIDSTLEVLAEYAVDLKFGLTEVVPGVPAPTLDRHAIGAADVYAVAATIAGGGTPQRIRALQVRFSTRAQRRDRDVAIANPTSGGIFRYNLGANRGFARVRTVTASISLPNMNGTTW